MSMLLRAILAFLLVLPAWGQAPLRMALLAVRPKARVTAQWQPMARHLAAVLGRPVSITAYNYGEMNAAIDRNEADVVLTNPGHYILVKQRSILSAPLVTLVAQEGEQRLSAFGGVIFCRAGDARIQTLRDLGGRSIATVGMESLGGYQMEAFELLEAGLPVPRRSQLLSLGMPHDLAVTAVLERRADVGFVRTGVLEAMAREGRIDLADIRVLNPQNLGTFPYRVSTRLHPEWPLALLPQVDAHLADQLAIALLQVQPDSDYAQAAGIHGFTTPSDYSGVEQMLRRLRTPPFDAAPEVTVADLWHHYAPWITATGLLMAALGVLSLRLVVQNRQIQQDQARSSAILNNVEAFIYLKGPDGRYLFANRKVLDLWGKTLEEVAGTDADAHFDPETVARIQAVDREVLVAGRTVRLEETNTVLETGVTATYLSTKLPLRRPDGEIYALCGISTDITERKQSEAARAYLAAIVESSEDAIVSKSLDGIINTWNQAAVRMFGYSVAEAVGQSITLLIPPERQHEEAEILRRIRAGESIDHLETVRLHKDGRLIDVTVTISPIRGGDGQIIGASKIIHDITGRKQAEAHRRQLEADLQQTQKLESLGSLAGGIAHDMNNVLAAIQAIAQTLTLIHAGDPRLLEALATIEKASTRGRDLVKGLTNFARKELREAELLDLNALVQDEMAILRRTTRQKVDLTLALDAGNPLVKGERSTLASALMNLCVNAIDAMPEGGSLHLSTRCRGEVVELAVQDNGQGMAPEVLARAMEPFYTTKELGKGTGLGLAMVYTTAKAHGGSVSLRSAPDQGTTVTLSLPRAYAEGAPLAQPAAPAAEARPLRILQVDDDELILASVPAMIAALGHQVRTATGGQVALDLLRGGLPADLVILDLNMPGMNGQETLRQIRDLDRALPVLLATGFLDAGTEAILQQDPRVLSIAKPFSMDELAGKFREIASL